MEIQFRDLHRQYQHLKHEIDHAIEGVITSAQFISGAQVSVLEQQLAEYAGVRHCITCGNGTDAISLALAAWGIGHKDAVFVPDFTFFSSAECPAVLGAVPVFTDVKKETFNMDPASLERCIQKVISDGKYTPKAVIAVDLFGLPAEYDKIRQICDKYGLLLLEDGAQGFGGSIHGRRACSFGDISTTSFFPAKPLGCYGDGGAVFTDDSQAAALIRSMAVHGKNADDKYDNVRLGMNSRLDTLQAAILIPKFQAFRDYELCVVNKAAAWYTEMLKGTAGLQLPHIPFGYASSWAQYAVLLPSGINRTAVQNKMRESGIPTMVYYAKPMHTQGAFLGTYSADADCPVTDELCARVLCLPIHPYLTKLEAERTADCLISSICEVNAGENYINKQQNI